VILVYDVMHTIGEKMALLEELHRVLKRNGFLSIFPMHVGTDGMLEIMKQCPLFRFRDSYTFLGHKTASEILNFNKC
jgi:ubiquinone/menaquinone biosynthesis C-methylase UbiE